MLGIIWSFLWFAGLPLLAVFNRRLLEMSGNKMAQKRKGQKFVRYYRNISAAG